MVNRRKRLEKQKARLADQALVDELALDLASQGLGKAAVQQSIPSIHHPLYFCIRSHYTRADQKWNFSTQLAWLKHQLQCMFMASEMARGLYPVEGRLTHEQLHGMMGSYVRFPAVWEGAVNRPITMEEACNVASLEDDTPKRHDLQWMCDTDQTQYLDKACAPKEESKDFLDVLFGDGKGAKLSEIAKALTPEGGGIYGEDHFHNEVREANLSTKIGGPIPRWRLPCPEDDE